MIKFALFFISFGCHLLAPDTQANPLEYALALDDLATQIVSLEVPIPSWTWESHLEYSQLLTLFSTRHRLWIEELNSRVRAKGRGITQADILRAHERYEYDRWVWKYHFIDFWVSTPAGWLVRRVTQEIAGKAEPMLYNYLTRLI